MAEQIDIKILGSLLGLIAHDMRNPLTALQSNISYLASALGEAAAADTREAFADASASSDSLAHLIDNVEVVSLVLCSALDALEKAPFRLTPLLHDVISRNQVAAQSHSVNLELAETDVYSDLQVFAHRDMLGRALQNLIRNSIQFAPSSEPIRISVAPSQNQCAILVGDGGPTLAPAQREAAFTATGQAAAKGTSGGRYSRGLGLFCAKACAEAAGATLQAVESESQGGNTWRVGVPLVGR
jgi:signal transduction histidine kinase